MCGKGSTKRPGRPQTEQRSHRAAGFPAGPAARNSRPDRSRRRDRFSTGEWCRRNDRKGTLIRHAGPAVALPVGTLPVTMIEPAFGTLLVTAVGGAALPEPGFVAAGRAAVALAAIAVRADPEQRLAFLAAANSRPENHFSMNRHPPRRRGLTSGNGSWQGKTSLDGGLLMKVAEPEPRCFEQRGSLRLPTPQYNFRWNVWMLMIDG